MLAKEAGSKAKFAEVIERSPGQVGHFIGKTPTKNIGKSLARHIEAKCGKPEGWLDVNHDSDEELTDLYLRLSPAAQAAALAAIRALVDSEREKAPGE